MSGKERCLSERQIFQYQVGVVTIYASNFSFKEAFKKFDTSTTGQVKTKLLGDILRQLSLNPTKNELQVPVTEPASFQRDEQKLFCALF